MKKTLLALAALFIAITLMNLTAWGQTTYTSTGTGGLWNAGPTWVGGNAPSSSTDIVIIADGTTVTINTAVSCASITVGGGTSGILTFDGAAARAVTVSGDVTVSAGGSFTTQASGTFTNTMSIGGNLTNNGTFDMSQAGSTLLCTVTFNKAGDQTISGTGTTTRFRSIVLDKGAQANRVLCSVNVSDAGASPGAITFTNGTWEQTANTFTVSSGSQTIGANGAWVFSGSGNLNMGVSASIVVTGTLTVNTSGTFTMGTGANSLTTVTSPTINFTAGTVNILGRLTLTLGSTTINGATININPQGAATLGATSNSFECSGTAGLTFSSGSVTLVNPNAAASSGRDVKLTSTGTVNISGGTIYLGDGVSTLTSSTFHGFIISSSGITLNNLVLQGGNIPGRDAVLQSNCAVAGTLTLTSNLFRDSTSTLTLSHPIAGTPANLYAGNTSSMVISGSASGINIPSSVTALNNLTVNNSSGTTLQANLALNGAAGSTLTMTSGNIALGGNTLTLGTSAAFPGTLAYTSGFLTGSGTFARWFGTSAITLPSAAGQFPMGVGSSDRNLWIGGTPGTGGTVSVQYNDASSSSTVSISDNASTYINEYAANWVVTTANSFAGSNLGLQIQGSGIPGISSVSDLDITGVSSAAPGTYVTPTGTTADPILQRSAISDQTALASTYYVSSLSGSPLPVEITSFTGLAHGRNVELQWNTATEINNTGFEVQKNTNGSWAKIGFVDGAGTSNVAHSYSFSDVSSAASTYSYRLKQID
ncbi:MAG: hypothetical protein WBZ48_12185, partial [Bacteroidota bacterium]